MGDGDIKIFESFFEFNASAADIGGGGFNSDRG